MIFGLERVWLSTLVIINLTTRLNFLLTIILQAALLITVISCTCPCVYKPSFCFVLKWPVLNNTEINICSFARYLVSAPGSS